MMVRTKLGYFLICACGRVALVVVVVPSHPNAQNFCEENLQFHVVLPTMRCVMLTFCFSAGGKSLLKWKGVMLSPDKSSGDKTPSVESCCDVTVISNPNTMTNSNCSLNFNQFTTDGEGNQVNEFGSDL